MRVLAQLPWDVREDPRGSVHEHPPLPDLPERRVRAPHRVVREVVQLRQRLDARVSGADEDEAEVALGLLRVQPCRGRLERAQETVAEGDRVGDVLEAAPVLRQAGDGNVRGTAPSATTSRS